jgi:cobyrinic acid a,c-diamide synthase
MSSIYLSAAHKSSGKTTITLGLCRSLFDLGYNVQAFKKGPDYIDPIWHGISCHKPSYNLDFHMMTRDEIIALFIKKTIGADVCLIEGNKGLYDGMDLEGVDSNAALAKLLGTPVVLVLDAVGVTRGIAPLILGYQSFDPDVNISGVILNKVGGSRHESKLRAVIERYTDIKVIGSVRMDADLAIAERHLGLEPGNETEQSEVRVAKIASRIKEQVNLEVLLDLAKAAIQPESAEVFHYPVSTTYKIRLAYAKDKSFGFYYQEDLDTLSDAGVALLPVDTLVDKSLPDVDGLIIGGGFPEMFIKELSGNIELREDIRRAVERGLPVYAECGGLMYLSRSLRWNDQCGAMVGAIEADTQMGARPVGRGYASLSESDDGLWPAHSAEIPAHEFHYSHLENIDPGLIYAYRVQRGHGVDGLHDGIVYKNMLASYCHRRGSGSRGWIEPFLKTVDTYRSTRHAATDIQVNI